MITCIEKINLKDLHGVMTASNDNKVRSWDLGLSLIGDVDMNTEIPDPRWNFKTRVFVEKRQENLDQIKEVLKDLTDENLKLETKRRTMYINENEVKRNEQSKKVNRHNWQT